MILENFVLKRGKEHRFARLLLDNTIFPCLFDLTVRTLLVRKDSCFLIRLRLQRTGRRRSVKRATPIQNFVPPTPWLAANVRGVNSRKYHHFLHIY